MHLADQPPIALPDLSGLKPAAARCVFTSEDLLSQILTEPTEFKQVFKLAMNWCNRISVCTNAVWQTIWNRLEIPEAMPPTLFDRKKLLGMWYERMTTRTMYLLASDSNRGYLKGVAWTLKHNDRSVFKKYWWLLIFTAMEQEDEFPYEMGKPSGKEHFDIIKLLIETEMENMKDRDYAKHKSFWNRLKVA